MSAPQAMNVAMMTSGGLAPCLSSSVAYLIEFWAAALKAGTISSLSIRMYIDGYKGVLTGDSTVISPDIYDECSCLHELGGSPIGNSRVKVRDICFMHKYDYMYTLNFDAHCNSLSHLLVPSTIHKLTNIKDCLARGFIKEGETPLEVAAQQLIKDGINVSKYYTYSHMFVLFICMRAHLTFNPTTIITNRSFIRLEVMIPTLKPPSYQSIFSKSMVER